jgi:hypothetical protein
VQKDDAEVGKAIEDPSRDELSRRQSRIDLSSEQPLECGELSHQVIGWAFVVLHNVGAHMMR